VVWCIAFLSLGSQFFSHSRKRLDKSLSPGFSPPLVWFTTKNPHLSRVLSSPKEGSFPGRSFLSSSTVSVVSLLFGLYSDCLLLPEVISEVFAVSPVTKDLVSFAT